LKYGRTIITASACAFHSLPGTATSEIGLPGSSCACRLASDASVDESARMGRLLGCRSTDAATESSSIGRADYSGSIEDSSIKYRDDLDSSAAVTSGSSVGSYSSALKRGR
jgi:hypothetical protein